MRPLKLTCALMAFGATQALAEPMISLEVVVGTVLVDTVAGMTSAQGITPLKPGDRIYLKSGSTALLSDYENGCFISLRSAGQYIVPNMENCISGQASVMPSNLVVVPTNGELELIAASTTGSFTPVAMGVGFFAVAASAAVYSKVVADNTIETPVSVP